MKSVNKIVRVQLDVPQSRIDDIERMMSATGISTRKDLFENALTFFEWAIQQRQAGRTFFSDTPERNKPCELLMPSLANVKKI